MRNVPAGAGHRPASVSTSETLAFDRWGAVFVASPNKGASRVLIDERRQPPAPVRAKTRNWPGSPQYGSGWSRTSKHLLRSPQSQKTDQKRAPTLAPGSRREPFDYIRRPHRDTQSLSPKTAFSSKRFGDSCRNLLDYRGACPQMGHKSMAASGLWGPQLSKKGRATTISLLSLCDLGALCGQESCFG